MNDADVATHSDYLIKILCSENFHLFSCKSLSASLSLEYFLESKGVSGKIIGVNLFPNMQNIANKSCLMEARLC